jgi:tripeptidyl-peptidase-2
MATPFAPSVLDYRVTLPGRQGARGLYLREAPETRVAREFTVSVSPLFHEEADAVGKVRFQMHVGLASTAPSWVKVPSDAVMNSAGKSFEIMVDPTQLAPGTHTGEEHLHAHW